MERDHLKTKLLESINHKRNEMIELANKEGYTSEVTIQCSQDLDKLLNEYQLILLEEKEQKLSPFQGLVQNLQLCVSSKSMYYI